MERLSGLVCNNCDHTRDFTYVDDIVEGVIRTSDLIAVPDPDWSNYAPDLATSNSPWRVYDVGNSSPVRLSVYIEAIEGALDMTVIRELLPLQPGDVPSIFAEVSALEANTGYRPATTGTM